MFKGEERARFFPEVIVEARGNGLTKDRGNDESYFGQEQEIKRVTFF
jgi:hypothetical protein